ncbi:immunoglobulin domain protein [Ostertagia ostertagi]
MLLDLVYFILLASVHAFHPPTLTTETGEVQHDPTIGYFIQRDVGQEIRLTCSDITNEAVEFAFPNLTDNRGYSEEDFNSRYTLEDIAYGHTLHIRDLKESDTGTYKCHSKDDPSLSSEIHIFVKGSGAFVPTLFEGLVVSESEFVIPCKSSRHVLKDEVELRANGKVWKTASKFYDPRIGFKINSKNAEEKIVNQLTFQCVYKGYPPDTATFLIVIQETQKNDLEFLFEEPDPWPYVGGAYSLNCILKLKGKGRIENKYQYQINLTCPRCSQSAVIHKKATQSDRIIHSITIDPLSSEDSGLYSCSWYFDTVLNQTITKNVDVSPKKGQIKVINRTPQEVNVKEGNSINLSAELAAFPDDFPGFNAKWIRKSIKPPKTVNETENLVSDNDHVINTDRIDGGRVNERIAIKNARTEMSGIYVLTIELLDTVRTIEWKVNVQNERISARIDIMAPNSWVVFDQQYYQIGTPLHVNCLVTAIPLATVTFMRRSPSSAAPWIDIDRSELVELKGTYESGYIWNTTVQDDLDLKCEGERDGKTSFEVKRVRASESEPFVKTSWTRSTHATSQEDPKEIYEGDNVKLTCTVPNDEEWTVQWVFREATIGDVSNVVDAHSRHLIANINNVTGSNAGEYVCVMKKGNQEKRLKQIISVVKTVKPYHAQSDPEKPRILYYGKSADFDCIIEGTPRPDFKWLKDGQPYEGGELSADNRHLHIARVAAEDKGEFECVATNRAGTSVYKFATKVDGAPKRVSSSFLFVVFMLLLGLLFCLITTVIMYLKQRKKAIEQDRALNVLYEQLMKTTEGPPPSGPKLPLDQRVYQLPYNRQFELERDNLEIGNRLGCGQFGQVWMGWLSKPRVTDSMAEKVRLPVAVKGPLVGTNVQHQKMLADELKIMCAIGKHPNVLALIGAITKNMKGGELYVVVELCDNGSLKEYLLKHKNKFINELKQSQIPDDGYLRPDSSVKSHYASEQIPDWSNDMESDRLISDSTMLATSDLISFAMQVANGMEYLSSIPCIHRDLAARNVLLTSKRICRIADFGMAKNENKNYYRLRKKNVLVPYRWMAIEAIQDGVYTLESDMWSFGILLYEIFTLGGLPYPTISNEDLLPKLLDGYRNTKPQYCHEDIYELMTRCWDKDPNERPNFTQCIHQLKEHLRLASPQLLERVELDLGEECKRQDALAQWLTPEPDPREGINGFGTVNPSSPKHTEHIYISEFSR